MTRITILRKYGKICNYKRTIDHAPGECPVCSIQSPCGALNCIDRPLGTIPHDGGTYSQDRRAHSTYYQRLTETFRTVL